MSIWKSPAAPIAASVEGSVPRDRLKCLNPVEYRDLRELAAHGVVPRLKTLGVFVQAGLVYPASFRLCAGVRDEIAAKEAAKKRTHLLSPTQLEQSLRARKESPIQ